MRLLKWVAPLAAVALLIGWSGASLRAEDAPAKPAVGKITGTVTGIDKKPAGNVTVSLFPPAPAKAGKAGKAKAAVKAGKGEKGAKKGPEPIMTTTTAADGTYTLSDIAVGDYEIQAGSRKDAAGYVHQAVSIKEGDALNVPLQLVEAKAKKPAAN